MRAESANVSYGDGRYVATAVSGIGGTAGFLYFHTSNAPILTVWQHWFASDALGIITVAPLIIEFSSASRQLPSRRGFVEGVAALVAAAKTGWQPQPQQYWKQQRNRNDGPPKSLRQK